MKKFGLMLAVLTLLCAMFIVPTSAYADGELIYSEDFTSPTLDYTDKNDNYEATVANGKLELLCYKGSAFYRLPVDDVTGLDKFTVVYDWKLISSPRPDDAGHTLYFLFGIKDDTNGIYCGASHVNGTEHLGTIINGQWGRKYRGHFQDETLQSKMANMNTDTFRIKIEVEDGVTKVYVNGKRYVKDSGEEWRDADKVAPLWYDGGFGFTSRGPGVDVYIDNIAIYAGTGLSIDDLPQMSEDPAPVETTTETPTTTPEPVETTTAAPTTTPAVTTTAAPTTTPKDTTTAKPADSTTATPAKSGCGSVVALGLIACLLPAAVIVCRKKR